MAAAANRAGSSNDSDTPVKASAADLLSQFQSLISSAAATTADGDHADVVRPSENANSLEAMEKPEQTTESNETNNQIDPKAIETSELTAMFWLYQFSTQCAKLDDLIEDTVRFQKMVERLTDITKRAHLCQATGFLIDISTRFGELRKSFESLRESYQDIRAEKDMPNELRAAQRTNYLF
ncbi:unnamed protein product [Echinostoma caproni]|uniref:Uncharacterized protein n=1 Tax=Echinostoma caproni TaxID=27848 RepID=A0A3P8CEN6_9TREM|nr:unnamed protein product [Echinostoma caproni]